jgi:tetratricopeptide (TPR) repeat protein
MRRASMLLVLAALAVAEDADEYFEIGVSYLKNGFFGAARRAFGESLAQAPGEPVTLAFLGLAAAAEGRAPAEVAKALRAAYANVPEKKALRLEIGTLLPSRKALRLLLDEYARHAARASGEKLRDVLAVAAFLEAHGGTGSMPSLDRLEREFGADDYATRLRASAAPCSSPTSPPSPSGSSS